MKRQIEFGNPSNPKVEQSIKVTFSPRNLVVLFVFVTLGSELGILKLLGDLREVRKVHKASVCFFWELFYSPIYSLHNLLPLLQSSPSAWPIVTVMVLLIKVNNI